jgi:hypothetical protein
MIKNSTYYLGVQFAFVIALTSCGSSSDSSTIPTNIVTETDNNDSVMLIDTLITHSPQLNTENAYAKFEFSGQGASSYTCELNGRVLSECTSPLTLMPLDQGEYIVNISAKNSAGVAGISASHAWSIKSLFDSEQSGLLNEDLIKTLVQPDEAQPNSWRGIFRINCDFSHSSYNDPIVFPGQENAAHLHRFYGNTLTDHNSTETSLFTEGESSCQGNKLNLSSYWVPALLAPDFDQQSGERLMDEEGQPAWNMVPAVVGNDDEAHEIFYYSAGIDNLDAIQPIPVGLRIIAGNHMAQPGQEQDVSIVRWHCQSWGSDDASNPQFSSSIPECFAPDRVRMDIFFPSCWNGTDLDSEDHKSHLAYPTNDGGPSGVHCPSSHPVPIVRPSYHYAFGVKPEVYDPSTLSSRGWKLAADMYVADENNAGGMSLHADWFNAWHPEVMQALLDNCIKERLDCHDGNLANGYRLSATRPGTQIEIAVINGGLGN